VAKVLTAIQPRVSDLLRGKINVCGLDTLVGRIANTGQHAEVHVSRAA